MDDDSVGPLIERKLVKPLGGPAEGQLWFWADDAEAFAHDRKWMDKMTTVLRETVRVKTTKAKAKNGNKTSRP